MRNDEKADGAREVRHTNEAARFSARSGLVSMMADISMPTGSSSVRVPWMDAEEAAAALGSTAHTMRRLAREGRSPALVRRVGGRWRWSRADVERFVRGEPTSVA